MPTPTAGILVLYLSRRESGRSTHEPDVLTPIAQSLAQLKKYRVDGHYVPLSAVLRPVFLVPDDPLAAKDAHRLGVPSAADLFGGVVPFRFVANGWRWAHQRVLRCECPHVAVAP